jgi:hypothetical protein
VKKVVLAAGTLSIASIMALCIGLAELQLRPAMAVQGPSTADLPPLPAGGSDSFGVLVAVRVILLVVTAVALVGIVVNAFSKQGRKRLLALAVILLLVLIAQAILSAAVPNVRLREQAAPDAGGGDLWSRAPSTVAVVPFEQRPPRWLLWAAAVGSVLLTAAGAAGIFVMVRRRRRPRGRERLAEQTRAAAEALGRGGDFRDVILRCYHEMSEVIREELGVERETAVTPREFAVFLARWGIPAHPVQDLTEVFEEARYGRGEASPQSEERALRSLSLIEHYCREAV